MPIKISYNTRVVRCGKLLEQFDTNDSVETIQKRRRLSKIKEAEGKEHTVEEYGCYKANLYNLIKHNPHGYTREELSVLLPKQTFPKEFVVDEKLIDVVLDKLQSDQWIILKNNKYFFN